MPFLFQLRLSLLQKFKETPSLSAAVSSIAASKAISNNSRSDGVKPGSAQRVHWKRKFSNFFWPGLKSLIFRILRLEKPDF
jgi:hypothetical protein